MSKKKTTVEEVLVEPKTTDTVPASMEAWNPQYKSSGKSEQWNATYFQKRYEYNNQESATIPDQTMSMRELYERQKRGLTLANGKVPVYESPEDGEIVPANWDKLDLSEKEQYMREKAQEIVEIEKKYKAERNKQEEEKRKTYYREMFAKEQELASKSAAPSAGADGEAEA